MRRFRDSILRLEAGSSRRRVDLRRKYNIALSKHRVLMGGFDADHCPLCGDNYSKHNDGRRDGYGDMDPRHEDHDIFFRRRFEEGDALACYDCRKFVSLCEAGCSEFFGEGASRMYFPANNRLYKWLAYNDDDANDDELGFYQCISCHEWGYMDEDYTVHDFFHANKDAKMIDAMIANEKDDETLVDLNEFHAVVRRFAQKHPDLQYNEHCNLL